MEEGRGERGGGGERVSGDGGGRGGREDVENVLLYILVMRLYKQIQGGLDHTTVVGASAITLYHLSFKL